jgi:hypothetical protein
MCCWEVAIIEITPVIQTAIFRQREFAGSDIMSREFSPVASRIAPAGEVLAKLRPGQ